MRGKRLLLTGLAAGLAFGASAALAGPADLDPSFGNHGVVTTAFGKTRSSAGAAVIQRDGKIVVAGYAGRQLALARYTKHGKLDRSFGSGGRVRPNVGGNAQALGLALQPDGKLVAVGYTFVSGNFTQLLVARFESNGSLDPSFGTGGVVLITPPDDASANAVALQKDGRILVAGSIGADWAVLRLLPTGAPDPSFGGGTGQATGTFGSRDSSANALALRSDGRIVVGGVALSTDQDANFRYHGFALTRLTSNGSVDRTFGSSGRIVRRIDRGGSLTALALQRNGDIVAGGSTLRVFGDQLALHERWALMRFHPNGKRDRTFGRGGIVVTPQLGKSASVNALVMLRKGKIAAVGTSTHRNYRASVVRYRKHGSLDRAFARRGIANTKFGAKGAEGNAVVLQANGRLVIAGDTVSRSVPRGKIALARYLNR